MCVISMQMFTVNESVGGNWERRHGSVTPQLTVQSSALHSRLSGAIPAEGYTLHISSMKWTRRDKCQKFFNLVLSGVCVSPLSCWCVQCCRELTSLRLYEWSWRDVNTQTFLQDPLWEFSVKSLPYTYGKNILSVPFSPVGVFLLLYNHHNVSIPVFSGD